MTLFFEKEKENFSRWKYHAMDNSITTYYFTPIYNYFLDLIPMNISPNMLTFLGLMCTLFGYYISYNYFEMYPKSVCFSLILLWCGYIIFDAIDGKQARRIGNSSPLGEFLDHACDIISDLMVILSLCQVMGIRDKWTVWYLVQVGELLFLEFHIRALRDKIVTFNSFYGPVEALCVGMIICLLRVVFTLNFNQFFVIVAPYMYYTVLSYVLYLSIKLEKIRLVLVSCLIFTFISYLFKIYFNINPSNINIIGNGCNLALITCDIILAKMGDTTMHYYMLDLILLSLCNSFLGIMITFLYYIGVLNELSLYLNMPLLRIKRNK